MARISRAISRVPGSDEPHPPRPPMLLYAGPGAVIGRAPCDGHYCSLQGWRRGRAPGPAAPDGVRVRAWLLGGDQRVDGRAGGVGLAWLGLAWGGRESASVFLVGLACFGRFCRRCTAVWRLACAVLLRWRALCFHFPAGSKSRGGEGRLASPETGGDSNSTCFFLCPPRRVM